MDTTDIDTVLSTELLTLRQVARIVARDDDAESRIQDILRHLAASHGLMRGRVLIADPPAGEIYIRYAHGLTAAELERGRYRVGEGVSGQVFETGVAVLVADVHDEPGYLGRIVPRESLPAGQVAFLVVPIVRDHLPIGVLAALRSPNGAGSAECDLVVMEVIAMLIAQILCAAGEALPWTCPAMRDSKRVPVPPVPAAKRTRRQPLPKTAPATTGARGEELGRHSRDLTLRMALQRHGEGRLHMAADLYLKVAEHHPDTDEAQAATSGLLEIIDYYEGQGNHRLAADVLKRLERVVAQRTAGDNQDVGFGSWDGFGDSGGSGGIGVRPR